MRRSEIWKFYNIKNAKEADCKICFKTIKSSGNTTNLQKHMRTHPECQKKDVLEDGENAQEKQIKSNVDGSKEPSARAHTAKSRSTRQQGVTECLAKRQLYEKGGEREVAISKHILYFVCKDKRPFDVVKGQGFNKLLKFLCPSYNICSVDTLKSRFDDIYNLKLNEIKNKFQAVSSFALTCDVWTETMSETSFLGVTAHYIDNYKMTSRCLATKELGERNTAGYIAENLRYICEEFNTVTNKITCIVTDNGPNMVAAVNNFLGRSHQLGCFAHTLNLVVEAVYKIDSFNQLSEKVRTVVKFFKNSVVYSDKLRSSQSCAQPLKPILDVRTRWNSLYYMFDRYVQLAPAMHKILVLDSKAPPIPTALELGIIKDILQILKPFEVATKEISGEQFVTVSKVIPIVQTLRVKMLDEISKSDSSNELIDKVKTVIHDQLTTRFKSVEDNHLLALSCVLDPRFKNIAFSDPCAYSRCMSWLRDMISRDEAADAIQESELSVVECSDKNEFWNHIETLASGRGSESAIRQSENINEYIRCKLLPLSGDPLLFWKENKNKYPHLSKIALRYLGVPATSVPSERLFSKAGLTMTKTRNRLKGKRLDKLLFMADCTEEEWGF